MGVFPLGVAIIELMRNGCQLFKYLCSKHSILFKSLNLLQIFNRKSYRLQLLARFYLCSVHSTLAHCL